MYLQAPVEARGTECPGAGVKVGCKLPTVGAWNWSHVLWKCS